MIQPYKKNAFMSGIIFIILNIIFWGYMSKYQGNAYWLRFSPAFNWGFFLLVLSGASWYYNFAKAKGYSGWWALLGCLHILGLIIILVLPDKSKGNSN